MPVGLGGLAGGADIILPTGSVIELTIGVTTLRSGTLSPFSS